MSGEVTVTTGPVRSARVPRGDLRVTLPRLVRAEWVKFWSLRSSKVAVALAVVGMIGVGILFSNGIAIDHRPGDPWDPRQAVDASLFGANVAQLVIGVLGVLLVSGEYGTGMIRASMAAAPKRLPVIWSKAIVFAVIVFVVSAAAAFVSFFAGQAILSGHHLGSTLGAPGALRGVLGTAGYLTGIGLLGGGLGWIIRNSAGAISTLVGILLILPQAANALPASVAPHVQKALPGPSGQAMMAAYPDPAHLLTPGTGFTVFLAYIVGFFAVGAVLVKRRDA